MKLSIFYFFVLYNVFIAAQRTNCPREDIHFEKVLGLRPSNSNLLLYNGQKDGKVAVTEDCIQRCNSNEDCRSFVIFFNSSSCYWYKNEVQGVQEFNNELDFNTAWFVKTCLKVRNCTNSWVFERIPGAILVGNSTKVLPNTYTRKECQQHCLEEKKFDCRSTKFKIKDSKYGPNEEVKGVCILSNSDRHLVPSSFRASSFDDEYFENQCSSNEKEIQGEFCSYEQYDNVTLSHVDAIFQNETKDTCEEICENYENFTCRGYSVVNKKNRDDCYLHSEDSKVYGPKLLAENYSATYFEKTPCLNITLTCTETYMTVRYTPSISFLGRMYMEGYSEQPQCFSKGSGFSSSVLKLSLLSKQCGIIKALAPHNRTLLTGTMILQFNPLVQTQGDRVIKVGCIFGNDSKVLAGTGITITTAPNHASPLLNTTGSVNAPNVEMRVVDLYSQQEVSSTQIGQELQLIIELKPADDLDIWAGHLIAMTEDSNESIILLDDTGCPTNINIFPALSRLRTNDSVILLTTFQAFKFSSSPVVRFSVIVQFCPGSCPPLNCPNYERTNVRTKREKVGRAIETIDGTQIMNVNRSEFDREKPPRMPLEFIMLVRNPGANSDRLVVSDGKILIAGYDYISNEVCLDYSLFIGLIVTWILIQVIFVVCCLVLVRRYKKYYEEETTTQSLEQLNKNFGIGFSNLDNRRVRWADNGDYT